MHWYVEVYWSNQLGPCYFTATQDFADLKTRISPYIKAIETKRIIVRIIGPSDAKPEELDELRAMGATPTFP